MKKYEINKETLAIIGIGKDESRIIEKENNYVINNNSYNIIEDSCNYFGSSFKGRIDGTKKMTGINYKVPIIIEESNELIFFPLSEIEKVDCTWISLNWFDSVINQNNKNYIYFKNGKKLAINISKNVVENQFSRALKLNYILSERKK